MFNNEANFVHKTLVSHAWLRLGCTAASRGVLWKEMLVVLLRPGDVVHSIVSDHCRFCNHLWPLLLDSWNNMSDVVGSVPHWQWCRLTRFKVRVSLRTTIVATKSGKACAHSFRIFRHRLGQVYQRRQRQDRYNPCLAFIYQLSILFCWTNTRRWPINCVVTQLFGQGNLADSGIRCEYTFYKRLYKYDYRDIASTYIHSEIKSPFMLRL